MNRRGFLQTLIGGVAAAAAVRTFPFRVFSFPSEIVAPNFDSLNATTLAHLRDDILYDNFFVDAAWLKKLRSNIKLDPALELHGGQIISPLEYRS